jgi:predicted Fe-Mo cluster-binding NifX family protein
MSADAVLAIPSDLPGGLDVARSGHFGRCECFTIVEITGGEVTGVRAIENAGHVDGGCLGPVQLLVASGVTAVLVSGIGGRPLQGLRAEGIDTYFDNRLPLVSEAIEAFRAGEVTTIGDTDICHG